METMQDLYWNVESGQLKPLNDLIMNQFHMFHDNSSNVSPENVTESNDRQIDYIVQKLDEEFFPDSVQN